MLRCVLRVRRGAIMRSAIIRWRERAAAAASAEKLARDLQAAFTSMRTAGARRFIHVYKKSKQRRLLRAMRMLKSNVAYTQTVSRVCFTLHKYFKHSMQGALHLSQCGKYTLFVLLTAKGTRHRFRASQTKQRLQETLHSTEAKHEKDILDLIGAAHTQRREQGAISLSRVLKTWMLSRERRAFRIWVSAAHTEEYRKRAGRCIARIISAQKSRRDDEKVQRAWMLLRANAVFGGYRRKDKLAKEKRLRQAFKAAITHRMRIACSAG